MILLSFSFYGSLLNHSKQNFRNLGMFFRFELFFSFSINFLAASNLIYKLISFCYYMVSNNLKHEILLLSGYSVWVRFAFGERRNRSG